MKAKFVYENIKNVFKPKEIGDPQFDNLIYRIVGFGGGFVDYDIAKKLVDSAHKEILTLISFGLSPRDIAYQFSTLLRQANKENESENEG